MDQSDCLAALIARYPDHADWIERLHELDPTFREVCRDHLSVTMSLATFRHRAAATASKVRELEALLAELDGEIAGFLDD